MAGSTDNTIDTFADAVRVLEHATVGRNELFVPWEHENPGRVKWTRFDGNGNVREVLDLSHDQAVKLRNRLKKEGRL